MNIDKADIGPQVNVYHGYRIRIREVIAALSIITIFFAIPFFIGLYKVLYGYTQFGPVAAFSWGFPWLFFSFFCFLLISIYCIYRLNIARISIYLHKYGFVIQKRLKKDLILKWEDVSRIYTRQEQSRTNRKSLRTKAVILTKNNVRLTLRDTMIENLPELLTQIKASVYIHLYPKIRKMFRSGEVISFGLLDIQNKYLRINQTGIKPQSPQIPWTEVKRITVKSGQLLIKLNNNKVLKTNTAKVPNIEILLSLINEKTKE